MLTFAWLHFTFENVFTCLFVLLWIWGTSGTWWTRLCICLVFGLQTNVEDFGNFERFERFWMFCFVFDLVFPCSCFFEMFSDLFEKTFGPFNFSRFYFSFDYCCSKKTVENIVTKRNRLWAVGQILAKFHFQVTPITEGRNLWRNAALVVCELVVCWVSSTLACCLFLCDCEVTSWLLVTLALRSAGWLACWLVGLLAGISCWPGGLRSGRPARVSDSWLDCSPNGPTGYPVSLSPQLEWVIVTWFPPSWLAGLLPASGCAVWAAVQRVSVASANCPGVTVISLQTAWTSRWDRNRRSASVRCRLSFSFFCMGRAFAPPVVLLQAFVLLKLVPGVEPRAFATPVRPSASTHPESTSRRALDHHELHTCQRHVDLDHHGVGHHEFRDERHGQFVQIPGNTFFRTPAPKCVTVADSEVHTHPTKWSTERETRQCRVGSVSVGSLDPQWTCLFSRRLCASHAHIFEESGWLSISAT